MVKPGREGMEVRYYDTLAWIQKWEKGITFVVALANTIVHNITIKLDQGYGKGVPPFSVVCLSHSQECLCTPRMKMV